MRFLLDQNLSPDLGVLLARAGHDATHCRHHGLSRAPDEAVLEQAAIERRILISADTDFGQLLAGSSRRLPSVILLRREGSRRAAAQATLILANLGPVEVDLAAGAVVVIEATRVRVRRLPI